MDAIRYDSSGNRLIINEREEQIVMESMEEFAQMQLWRNTFASQWEEVAELVLPTSRNTFYYGNFNWPGQKKTDRQVDASAMMALHRFGAILDSLLTPRNQIWHQLTAQTPELKKDRATRLWYQEVTRRLFNLRYAPIANFSAQNQNNYQSLGAFGTGGMFVDQAMGPDGTMLPALRYKAIPLGELFLHENHQGLIDGFIRWFRLTPRQAMQKWGEKCPAGIIAAAEKHSETPYNFIHRVCPRSDYDPNRIDEKGKLFASYYISLEGRCLLQEGGYKTFPIAASRYDQTPGEVYGRSPAMMVLPAIKTLNAEKRVFLKQGHRAADPVLLTADDGLVDINMRPGALNKGGVNSDGKALIQVLPTGEIQISKEMMEEEKSLINDAFLVTLFQILTETPQMTATEVIERTNEKGILLAPTVGRQQNEYLGPMIDRELDLMASIGLLPPMPPALREARGEYHVNYTSPLSRAQRAQEVSGFMRTIESSLTIVNATQDPSLLDVFDFDTALRDVAEIQAVPESWMADPQAIAQKRQARAESQQRQEQIQAAPAQAAMMKAQAVQQKAGMANGVAQARGAQAANTGGGQAAQQPLQGPPGPPQQGPGGQ
jgi:hypothetical protein